MNPSRALAAFLFGVAAGFLLFGCAEAPCEHKWGYYVLGDSPAYAVAATRVSPSGVAVDEEGGPVDLLMLDRKVNEVEICLERAIDRSAFYVKVPAGWGLSCDGTDEVLPLLAPPAGCRAKGLEPDDACPCRWRALVQCPNVIVTTPNLHLFKDALVRWTVGCTNPWIDPALATCASP